MACSSGVRFTCASGAGAAAGFSYEKLINAPRLLSAVINQQKNEELKATKKDIIKPLSGFRVSNLFTGGQGGVALGEEIIRDIASADHISIIVSFLRLSGIRMILDELRKFCSVQGHTLRIITTTYCGITEAKAVEQLSELPNTEIHISYNTQIERLNNIKQTFLASAALLSTISMSAADRFGHVLTHTPAMLP